MKRYKPLLSILAVLIMLMYITAPADAETISTTKIFVNNKALPGAQGPVNSSGSILVAAEELADALGGTFRYDNSSLTGTIRQGENELVFRLDNSVVKCSGKYIIAPAPMRVVNYRFMIPADFTARKLGAEVYMNTIKDRLLILQPVDGKIVYQVMSGDTLWILSQTFGTTISSLRQLNNLNGDYLYIGQKLIIRDIPPFSTITAARTTKNATLRSGPGFDFSPIGYVAAATDISVIGKNEDWFKVVTPKGTGYMYYTVMGVIQDMPDTAPDSTFFTNNISVDTSKNYITYNTYTVQKGDTLWSISEKYGITTYELAKVNNLASNSYLYIGQILKIPVNNIPEKEKLGSEYGEILDWFSEAQYIFPVGKTGKVIDMETGKSFMVQRTMGANHSDTETLTDADTQIMKEMFGGTWNWDRRAFILEVEGRRFAVSAAGMPHAGVDTLPYMQNVYNRSDGWGYGPNYDRIKGNGMDGHFDLYFLNGLRHKDGRIDPSHQYRVLEAGGLR